MTIETNHAIENAKAWLENIVDIAARLGSDDEAIREKAEEESYAAPLSVLVRSGWYEASADAGNAQEYEILLSTGGPALRIIGDLNQGRPENARLQWQEWGTPWTDHRTTSDEEAALIAFASAFYYGE